MGQRNTPNTSHMIDYEADQPGQSYIHPEPCVFYGNIPTFPQPNVHTVVPVSGNASNTYLRPLPEQHANALFYGMGHYNGTVHQRPNHYNPYMAAPSAAREFPVPVIHGTHDHLPFTAAQGMAGIHRDSYGWNIPYTDGSFKRKNAMAGSSSSVAPVIAMSHEAEASDPSPMTEVALQSSLGSRSGVNGQGSFVGQVFPLPVARPWLDMQLNTNQGAPLHYAHGGVGGCVDGNMGVQGYQVTAGSGSLSSFMRPPHIPHGFSSVHHLSPSMQGMRGQNVNFPPQMAASSRRIITSASSGSTLSPSPGVVDAGPTYMGPFPPTGFRFYGPHRRDFMAETNMMRNHNVPNMRVLPEEGVAVLEIPDYGVAESVDQHREMRMDIDHMSYEELLALGDRIGCVTTGLSEEFIMSVLKTVSFSSSNSYSVECLDQETDFCVICQHDYKDQDKIGVVECGHEYHVDCIKKWLVVKNSCPVCKSTALSTRKTGL